MTQLLTRLVRPLMLAVALGGTFTPAYAANPVTKIIQNLFQPGGPSQSGSFMAGQQALKDLRTDEAAAYFAGTARDQWDNPVLVERAFVALAADGQVDEAASFATHLLELDPNNELAKLVLGTVALKQDRFADTEAMLASMSQDSFTAITGTILRAWAFIGDKQSDKADSMLDALAGSGLEDFLVFHRALMAEVEGKTDKAIELAQQAFDAEPMVARIVEVYTRLLADDDRFDEASAAIAKFEGMGLNHPVVTEVKNAIAKRQHPGPFTTSTRIGAAEMYQGIGVALSRDGSAELALVFLRMAQYLDPNSDIITLAVGQMYDQAGQQKMANKLYGSISAKSMMGAAASVRIAQNLDVLGDRPEALRKLDNTVAAQPDNLDAVSVLGDMLRFDEQYPAAAKAYTKALALTGGESKTDWRLYYVRGIAYERSKQWPKAEADFLKSLKLVPDQPAVLNYLGYSWIDQDMHLDEALGMIQKAVSATPHDGYVVDSLGWAFYKLGRDDEAVTTLEQAVQMLPNDPEINDHLGDAYLKVGRALEAQFQWNIAAAVDTVGTVRDRVAPKLAALAALAPAVDKTPVAEATPAIVPVPTTP